MSRWGNIGRPLIVIIMVALVSMTVVSSLIVYTAQQTARAQVELVASNILRAEIKEEAQNVVTNTRAKFQEVETLLSLVSHEIQMDGDNKMDIENIMDSAHASISNYATGIIWVDQEGMLLYTTDTASQNSIGNDLSGEQFYGILLAKKMPFVALMSSSVGNETSYVAAVPILLPNGSFNGAVAALGPATSLASVVLEQGGFGDEEQAAILAPRGTILAFPDNALIGKNIQEGGFGEPSSADDTARKNIDLMLQGRSGTFNYNRDGQEFTMAYEPVIIDNVHVWTVGITTPSSRLTEPFTSVFAGQQDFYLTATLLIAVIAAVFIGFILFLNRRLFSTISRQDVRIHDQLGELQGAYNRLKEQDVIKDEFINVAAHELRTPVLPIVLSAENLADEMPENENIKIILRNANRITKLTNDILDVSRIESNTFRLQKEKVNIHKLAEEVIQDAKFKIPAEQELDIVLQSSVSPAMEELLIDKSRINQVLVNLVDNAVNFTEKGTIKVVIESEGSRLKVSVTDEGKGIDPAILPRLFGKFVSKSEKAKGTGLGLYLSKAIVEAHGGTISGVNNPSGKGATFSFTLPVA